MRGPSSSHTAASHRIGLLVRQLFPVEGSRIVVEFDRNGSLATTYEGQGSAMGLIGGLAGVSILDPSVTGEPLAIIDGTTLTAYRTAAVSSLGI